MINDAPTPHSGDRPHVRGAKSVREALSAFGVRDFSLIFRDYPDLAQGENDPSPDTLTASLRYLVKLKALNSSQWLEIYPGLLDLHQKEGTVAKLNHLLEIDLVSKEIARSVIAVERRNAIVEVFQGLGKIEEYRRHGPRAVANLLDVDLSVADKILQGVLPIYDKKLDRIEIPGGLTQTQREAMGAIPEDLKKAFFTSLPEQHTAEEIDQPTARNDAVVGRGIVENREDVPKEEGTETGVQRKDKRRARAVMHLHDLVCRVGSEQSVEQWCSDITGVEAAHIARVLAGDGYLPWSAIEKVAAVAFSCQVMVDLIPLARLSDRDLFERYGNIVRPLIALDLNSPWKVIHSLPELTASEIAEFVTRATELSAPAGNETVPTVAGPAPLSKEAEGDYAQSDMSMQELADLEIGGEESGEDFDTLDTSRGRGRISEDPKRVQRRSIREDAMKKVAVVMGITATTWPELDSKLAPLFGRSPIFTSRLRGGGDNVDVVGLISLERQLAAVPGGETSERDFSLRVFLRDDHPARNDEAVYRRILLRTDFVLALAQAAGFKSGEIGEVDARLAELLSVTPIIPRDMRNSDRKIDGVTMHLLGDLLSRPDIQASLATIQTIVPLDLRTMLQPDHEILTSPARSRLKYLRKQFLYAIAARRGATASTPEQIDPIIADILKVGVTTAKSIRTGFSHVGDKMLGSIKKMESALDEDTKAEFARIGMMQLGYAANVLTEGFYNLLEADHRDLS